MADMYNGQLLWKQNKSPIDSTNPVNTLDNNSGDMKTSLASIDGKVSTAEAQALLKQVLDLIEADTTTLAGKDFATQTTLAAVLAKLAELETELATIKANQLSGNQKVQLNGNLEALTSANTAAIYNATMRNPVTGLKTVTATAAEVFAGASRLNNRRRMLIRNEDQVLRCRVGSASVTQQNGFPLEPGATIEMEFEPSVYVQIYAVSEGAPLQLAVIEL